MSTTDDNADTGTLPDFQTYDELIAWAIGQQLMVNMGPCPCGECGRDYYRPTERGILAMAALVMQACNAQLESAELEVNGELGRDLRGATLRLLIPSKYGPAMCRIGNSM